MKYTEAIQKCLKERGIEEAQIARQETHKGTEHTTASTNGTPPRVSIHIWAVTMAPDACWSLPILSLRVMFLTRKLLFAITYIADSYR